MVDPVNNLSTFEDALRWLNDYGGICATIEELKRTWHTATCGQLRAAAFTAARINHRPEEEIDRAMVVLVWGGK